MRNLIRRLRLWRELSILRKVERAEQLAWCSEVLAAYAEAEAKCPYCGNDADDYACRG